MRGSYLAKIVDGEVQREKRRKEFYELKKFKQKCKTCKNQSTDICHITRDIEGNLKCAFYED